MGFGVFRTVVISICVGLALQVFRPAAWQRQ